jgi:hypothetical protein
MRGIRMYGQRKQIQCGQKDEKQTRELGCRFQPKTMFQGGDDPSNAAKGQNGLMCCVWQCGGYGLTRRDSLEREG